MERAKEMDLQRAELKSAEEALQAQHTQVLRGESYIVRLGCAEVVSLLTCCFHSSITHFPAYLLHLSVCMLAWAQALLLTCSVAGPFVYLVSTGQVLPAVT